jgi:hypothetical protein
MGKHNPSVPLSVQFPAKLPTLPKNQRRDLLPQVSSSFSLHTLPFGPQYPHSLALGRSNEYPS